MAKSRYFLVALFAAQTAFAQLAGSSSDPRAFPSGVVLPKVVATAKPEQSYALYLPTSYSPAKRWPIIYAFDPGARGRVPVDLMKDAAERNGYIVVGSNNSRNGSWSIEAEAAQAMLQDTQGRLSLDSRRVYFAGFSGGARVAAVIAQQCKCAAGLFLNGAGFQTGASAKSDTPFAVFSAMGTYDFNYPEIIQTDDELEKLSYAHFLRRFAGPHQWAPPDGMEEALAWFRLQAMKSGWENRDESFITAQMMRESERARSLEQSGDLYSAWKEYRQAGETFTGLADSDALRSRSKSLEEDRAVHEGAKREKQEFEEQSLLTHEISTGLAALHENPPNPADVRSSVEQQIADLRARVNHEKHEDKLRVLKRALAGVMVQAAETGDELLEKKDPHRARDFFELAVIADPDSVWALSNAAVARALDGDRKGTMTALRLARTQTKDPATFVSWLRNEPAFAKFRGTPEFTALLEASPQE